MKKYVIIIFSAVLIAVILRYVISSLGGFKRAKAKFNPPQVTVENVKTKRIIPSYEAPGRVEAKFQVEIVARVAGYLEHAYFKEGSCVKKGDTLFLIEPNEYSIDVSVASADVKKISAQLDYANKQLIRAQELVKKDFIAKARYDELKSNRDSLQAQLAAAKSGMSDAQRNLGYTKIKAPVDGRIGVIDVSVGNYVTPQSTPLTTINSIDPIYVMFPLSADDYSDITSVDNGDNKRRKVELYFNNGKKYEYDGVQDFFDNKVDETTGTVSFRATFKNPEKRLLHGEFVRVRIYANNPVDMPIIPVTAVQENQEGKYVYKLDDNNLPQLTYIKTGDEVDNNWIIKAGVKTGDKIITSGIMKVIPNKPIKIIKNQE